MSGRDPSVVLIGIGSPPRVPRTAEETASAPSSGVRLTLAPGCGRAGGPKPLTGMRWMEFIVPRGLPTSRRQGLHTTPRDSYSKTYIRETRPSPARAEADAAGRPPRRRGRGAPPGQTQSRPAPRAGSVFYHGVPPPPAPPRPSVDILERSALMPSSVSSSLRACTTLLIKPAGSRASHPREVPEEEWLQRRHSEQGEVLALPPPTRKSARRHKPASPRYYGARDLDAPLLAARRTHAAAE